MKKNHYLFLALLIVFSSCEEKKKSIKETKVITLSDFPKVNQNLDFIGLYTGILPCADCDGMETKIILNENNTYTKSVHYLGKGSKIFEQKGVFSWNELGNVVLLEEVKNAPNQYIVSKSKLIQLNSDGNIISGSLASEYELSKHTNPILDIETVPMEGNIINLNNQLEATASVEQVNPAEGKFTLAETKWKLVKLNGKKIKQTSSKVNFIKMNSKDGKFSAYAGCNQIFGSYAMPNVNSISFSEAGATRMACADMSIENDFFQMLETVIKYKLDNETLMFYDTNKSPIATFAALK